MRKTIVLFFLALFCGSVIAGGNGGHQQPGSSTSTAVGVGVGVGIAGGGGGGEGGGGGAATASSKTSNDSVAIGLGSTGLATNAECAGSRSVLWNMVSETFIFESCIGRRYADRHCPTTQNPKECFKIFACYDPDLSDDLKAKIYNCSFDK